MSTRMHLQKRLFSLTMVVAPTALFWPAGTATAADLPEVGHEFRGFFVATAYNLDWPSRSGLHWLVQTDQIEAIVARAKELNCNVIILQVRAFGDRIHRGGAIPDRDPPFEPWSPALNYGRDPDYTETYDPLATWIQECHANGIELHAWINPFRVKGGVKYKQTYLATVDDKYLDPKDPLVQEYVRAVIHDLIDYRVPPKPESRSLQRRKVALLAAAGTEGVDGILYDHQMPPTEPPGPRTKPAETAPAAKTQPAGLPQLRGPAKRRSAIARNAALLAVPTTQPVDETDAARSVQGLVTWTMEEAKDHQLKFGISPKYDDQVAMKWLEDGNVHYVIPELYFPGSTGKFSAALQPWLNRVKQQGDFTPIVLAGLLTSRVQLPPNHGTGRWKAQVIEDQIAVCNSHQWPAVRPSGHVHYSWSALRSPGHGGPPASEHDIGDHLKKKQPIPGAYSDPVLVPQIHQGVASAPKVDWTSNGNGGHTVTWTPGDTDEDVLFWAFWERDGQTQKWSAVKLKHRLLRQQDVGSNVDKVAVKAIARKHGESGFGTKP